MACSAPPAAVAERARVVERVAVTGAAGGLGRAVLADLEDHGYEVLALDRTESDGVRFWDGRDVEALVSALAGCGALVHLAAIPVAWSEPDEVTFGNNTTATFAALTAAGRAGVRRVVIASSGSAYGTAWSQRPTHAHYVPVDEDHPMENADPYGLSKEVDERTAAMACRRWPMSVAALRFHWIATREQQLRAIAERRARPRDWPEELRSLWGYVDRRDAARACRLAIEAAARQPYGFAPMNIVAADALADESVVDLMAEHAPDIEIRVALGPTDGAFAIERARRVIGWVPRHSWRDGVLDVP